MYRPSFKYFFGGFLLWSSLALLLITESAKGPENESGAFVHLDATLECLCPFAQHLVYKQIAPVMQKIRNLTILGVTTRYYGKCEKRGPTDPEKLHNNFRCQHGPRECQCNMMMMCAQKYVPDPFTYIDVSSCVMRAARNALRAPSDDVIMDIGKKCLTERTTPLVGEWRNIAKCTTSVEGIERLEAAGRDQLSRGIPGDLVPWIRLNGKEDEVMQLSVKMNFLQVVCFKLYIMGGPCPAACDRYFYK